MQCFTRLNKQFVSYCICLESILVNIKKKTHNYKFITLPFFFSENM